MDQYRVFGNPIKQSRSPFIHQEFAKSTKQVLQYQTQLVELDAFTEAVQTLIKEGGKGANVTVPFKEQALALSDQLSDRARLAGAVNTLSFCEGKILGDNTDGLGLVQDLIRNEVKLKNVRILILGAGGAAKGVILPLLEQLPKSIVVANRTVSKAQLLCEQFSEFSQNKLTACGFDDVGQKAFDIIINATSASLSGNIPPISSQLIKDDVVCYDMVYGKQLTPFLSWAKEHGASCIIDGLGMLVGQAAESFAIWRNVKPEVEVVISNLRSALAAEQ